MFILARWIAKFSGIWLFSNKSNLTKAQVIAISLALSPMAAVAIGLTNILENFNPHFGHRLLVIMTSVVAILNIIGPILTQLAFIQTGEALRTLTYSQESRTQPC
ncbi:MAG: hypothetical protein JO131_09775 [Gammaproteobacteria bacterium]|nr:hypothetical protein [Gammaproteobacteria bacterium]